MEAATATLDTLSAALPGVAIGLVHGKLKPADKASVMAQFKAGTLQLLVATTVIEVDVDVPRASLMIIDNAERFRYFRIPPMALSLRKRICAYADPGNYWAPGRPGSHNLEWRGSQNMKRS